MASPNKFNLATGKDVANLQTLFAKASHIFYSKNQITSADLSTKGIEFDLELPVLADGVTFNMGEPDKTETKLTTGIIWVSRADKGDSDISFQVSSMAGAVNDLFMTKKTASFSGVTFAKSADFGIPEGNVYEGVSYASDVKKLTGSLLLTDDNAQTVIILPNIEAYAGLVVSDGDSPAYFNVSVTPKINSDGADIIVLTMTEGTTNGITNTVQPGVGGTTGERVQ